MMMILIILGIQIIYVSFFTVRMIFTLKGQRTLASMISAVEVFIYMTGLSLVLKNLDDPKNLAAYCVGYAIGVLVGSKIEEWVALGYVTVQIITGQEDSQLAEMLREQGYGVTSWLAEGRDGARLVLEVLTKRKFEPHLFKLVDSISEKAFIISHEPRNFRGGFWVKTLKQ
ncbi:DUF2179 domain-containing protein [Zhaonella formicivorans]|uniref:DUF2179 domain-containing protein n=1 Tax=Zhaonella formicivorans TaxID=2528593 RepID=UPI0010F37A15|nr:DUF2179 domain-containing protein [Zhaonella formicivorans]